MSTSGTAGSRAAMRIGLISDTHGLLRPQAEAWLRGSDHILHAGDIVDPATLDRLAAIAPLTAVRGNNDRGAWAERLEERVVVRLGGLSLLMIHDLAELRTDPADLGVDVVVSGHSHRPHIEWRGPVLYVNPGSAGPRRFTLPIAAGELRIADGVVTPRVQTLDAVASSAHTA